MHFSQSFLVQYVKNDIINLWLKTPQDNKQQHSGTGTTTSVTTQTRDN